MDYILKYAKFIKQQAKVKRPMRIVCDSSNGTTSIVLKQLTGIENLELILINTNLDPEFPAHGPNPLVEDATNELSKKVVEANADFGVVFDADGDRAFFVDNEGKLISSFISAAVLFKSFKPPFVTDELVYMSLTSSGIVNEKDLVSAKVGSIFIKEAMKKHGAVIGAEYSGHFYFKSFFGLDSGIMTLINMVNILSNQDKKLSDICAEFTKQYTGMINLNLKKTTWEQIKSGLKEKTSSYAEKCSERDGLTFMVKDTWVNVRPSNTEPLVRISAGANSQTELDSIIKTTSKIVNELDK